VPAPGGWLAVPAGVVLGDGEAEFLEFSQELAEASVVVEPGAVVGELLVGQDAGGGPAVFLAAGKLADYAIGLGLEPVPEVLLHPSVTERFTRCAPGLSPVARRTLRTNLRFIGRRVVPQLCPADLPLPRERSKQPYSPAEIDGYLSLADAHPAAERRMRAAGHLPGVQAPG
jgi:hypothetical protein